MNTKENTTRELKSEVDDLKEQIEILKEEYLRRTKEIYMSGYKDGVHDVFKDWRNMYSAMVVKFSNKIEDTERKGKSYITEGESDAK